MILNLSLASSLTIREKIMRQLCVVFALLIASGLSAQTHIDTTEVIKKERKSLISIVLTDTLFIDIQFVLNHYDAVVHVSDSIIYKTKTRKIFNKKFNDTIKIDISNPFEDIDYNFVVVQKKDTTPLLLPEYLYNKTSVNVIESASKPILLIEKPIFSTDLKHAYIRTSIDYNGGCVGYESYYIFENEKWIKVKSNMTYRC